MGGIYTASILETLHKLKAGHPYQILEVKAVNYTPFMPGDYDTKTFHCVGSPRRNCMSTKPQLAQQLRGRMRWLARIVLASLKGCCPPGGDCTFKHIEEECYPIVLGTPKDKPVKLGLIEFLFGTIRKDKKGVHFASPFKLQVLVESYDNKPWKPQTSASTIRKLHLVGKRGIRYIDRYNALLSRTTREGILGEELRPFAQNSVRLRIKVYLEPHAENLTGTISCVNSQRNIKEVLPLLAALYSGLLLTTLTVIGIGKGVNRGFGRFKIEDVPVSDMQTATPEVNELIRQIRCLQNAETARDAVEALRNILNWLINVARDITCDNPIGDVISRVPRLSTSIGGLSHYNLKGITVIDSAYVQNVDDAIEAIAASVTKQWWKHNIREDGVAYHTWILGLPRGSSVNCTCGRNVDENVQQHYRRKKDKKKVYYGYYVLSFDIGNNRCIPSSNCCKQEMTVEELAKKTVKGNFRKEVSSTSIRRQSMFILFPVNDSRPNLIAVIPLYALDMNFVDENLKVYYRNIELYHVGGHFVGQTPCCNAHFVSVKYALEEKDIPPPNDNRKLSGCGCACGKVRGGIKAAGGADEPIGNYVYLDILRAAYKSIEKILRG